MLESVVIQANWIVTWPWRTYFCTFGVLTSSNYPRICPQYHCTYPFGVGCTSKTIFSLLPDIPRNILTSFGRTSHLFR